MVMPLTSGSDFITVYYATTTISRAAALPETTTTTMTNDRKMKSDGPINSRGCVNIDFLDLSLPPSKFMWSFEFNSLMSVGRGRQTGIPGRRSFESSAPLQLYS